MHVTGKANYAADATSQNPAVTDSRHIDWVNMLAIICVNGTQDAMELDFMAGLRSSLNSFGVTTWADIQRATLADPDF